MPDTQARRRAAFRAVIDDATACLPGGYPASHVQPFFPHGHIEFTTMIQQDSEEFLILLRRYVRQSLIWHHWQEIIFQMRLPLPRSVVICVQLVPSRRVRMSL